MISKSLSKILFLISLLATVALYQNCAEDFDPNAYSSANLGSGGNNGGGTPPPPPPPDALVTAGARFSCALKNNTVHCWGLNVNGQLGDGTQVSRANPQPVNFTAVGNPMIRQVSAGKNHACALTAAGTIFCWGGNELGQLGVNLSSAQLAQSLVPRQSATPANLVFTKVSAGQYFTCALANTGSVYCWGTDQAGQLGSNLATTSSIVPVLVNNLAGVTDIAAGFSGINNTTTVGRACAVTNVGQVYCWGAYYNVNNALTNAFLPLLIGGITNPKAISVSANFACVLRTTNDVQCFGRNNFGQLGTGTSTPTASTIAGSTPVTNLSNVISISVGEDHACANHNGGLISCWGRNQTTVNNLPVPSGQLGKDPVMLVSSATPLVLDGQTDVEFVAAGDAHNCIGLNSGAVRCFGYNANFQLGYTPPQGQPNPNFIFNPTTVVLP